MILKHRIYIFLSSLTVLCLIALPISSLKAQDFDFPEDVEAPDLQSEFIEARMWMLMDQHDQAAEALEKLLEKDADNAIFLYELARCYDQLDEGPKALELAEQAHRNAPSNVWILQLLANIAASENRDDLAESTYAKLMSLHPERTNYGISRAYHLLLMGQREEAIGVLNQAESVSGVNPEISAKKISIFKHDDNWEAIDEEYRNIIETFPGNTDFRMEYASFLESRQNYEAALEQYREVSRIDPSHSQARVRINELETGDLTGDERLQALLPIVRDENVDLDEKVQALIPLLMELSEKFDATLADGLLEAGSELIQKHPNRAEPRALTGDVAFSAYQFYRADELYGEALDLRSDIVQVWFNQFEAILKTRDYRKLTERVNEALDFYPNQALFYYYLARGQMGKGDIETAENTLRRAELMAGRQAELQLYFDLADAALKHHAGDTDGAIRSTNTSLEKFPGEPDLLLIKADLLLQNGENTEEVGRILDQLEQKIPGHPEVLFARARVYYLSGEIEAAQELMNSLAQYDLIERADIAEWRDKISDTAER